MWKKNLAAALSAVTAAIEAVTAAIEAGTADQYNCITAQNTADVPLLYGKGVYITWLYLNTSCSYPLRMPSISAQPWDISVKSLIQFTGHIWFSRR